MRRWVNLFNSYSEREGRPRQLQEGSDEYDWRDRENRVEADERRPTPPLFIRMTDGGLSP